MNIEEITAYQKNQEEKIDEILNEVCKYCNENSLEPDMDVYLNKSEGSTGKIYAARTKIRVKIIT